MEYFDWAAGNKGGGEAGSSTKQLKQACRLIIVCFSNFRSLHVKTNEIF